jgi:hypothetical protein
MRWYSLPALAALAFLALGAAPAAAVPAPLPSLAPGELATPSAWSCSTDPATSVEACEVTSWQVLPAAPAPADPVSPLPVTVTAPINLDPAGFPLAVSEVSPPPAVTSESVCGPTSPSSSPSPSATSEPATEPSPSPSPSSAPSPAPCVVTTALVDGQAFGLWLFLGSLTMLGVFTVLRREGRGFRG